MPARKKKKVIHTLAILISKSERLGSGQKPLSQMGNKKMSIVITNTIATQPASIRATIFLIIMGAKLI
jgi:hypothetical protein